MAEPHVTETLTIVVMLVATGKDSSAAIVSELCVVRYGTHEKMVALRVNPACQSYAGLRKSKGCQVLHAS